MTTTEIKKLLKNGISTKRYYNITGRRAYKKINAIEKIFTKLRGNRFRTMRLRFTSVLI